MGLDITNKLPLDRSQAAFCQNVNKAVRLLAPAGSGKTHSLLYRCLCLNNSSTTNPSRFLIFTFTRAAKDELRERLTKAEFNSIRPFVEITTLNAWGFRRLKGKLHSLKLCTTAKDRYFCVNNILQASWKDCPHISVALQSRYRAKTSQDILEWSDKLKGLGFRHDKLSTYNDFRDHIVWLSENGMGSHIEAFLSFMRSLEITDFSDKPESGLKKIYKEFILFWRDACDRMYQSSFITLEDQKYWAVIDLEQSKPTTGVHRQEHILVDEFQDINVLDLQLLKAIAAANKTKLTLVGDDDQAIYEWRGATPRFILKPEIYLGEEYETCILERNYRSARNIVNISQKLIKNNKNRVPKVVTPVSKLDTEIKVLSMPTLSDSINYVLSEVKSMLKKPGERLAIISRKRSQIIPYQIVLASNNIPFCAAEDLQIFLSEAFRSLASMLLIKTHSSKGFFPGIDFVTEILLLCDSIRHYPLNKNDRENLRHYFLKQRPKNLPEALEQLSTYSGSIKGDTSGNVVQTFSRAISNFINAKTVSQTINCISLDFNGLQKDYGKGLEDIFYADPPFLYLADYAKRYGDDFLTFCDDIEKAEQNLVKIPPDEDVEADLPWKKPIHLMTALRAKGKEFDNVIILDVNDDIWPIKFAVTDEELEQERRLFYVAFTRAKKRLIILVNQNILGQTVNPSPYLAEMGLPITKN